MSVNVNGVPIQADRIEQLNVGAIIRSAILAMQQSTDSENSLDKDFWGILESSVKQGADNILHQYYSNKSITYYSLDQGIQPQQLAATITRESGAIVKSKIGELKAKDIRVGIGKDIIKIKVPKKIKSQVRKAMGININKQAFADKSDDVYDVSAAYGEAGRTMTFQQFSTSLGAKVNEMLVATLAQNAFGGKDILNTGLAGEGDIANKLISDILEQDGYIEVKGGKILEVGSDSVKLDNTLDAKNYMDMILNNDILSELLKNHVFPMTTIVDMFENDSAANMRGLSQQSSFLNQHHPNKWAAATCYIFHPEHRNDPEHFNQLSLRTNLMSTLNLTLNANDSAHKELYKSLIVKYITTHYQKHFGSKGIVQVKPAGDYTSIEFYSFSKFVETYQKYLQLQISINSNGQIKFTVRNKKSFK